MAKAEMLGEGRPSEEQQAPQAPQDTFQDRDVPTTALATVIMSQAAWDKMAAIGKKIGKSPQAVLSEAMFDIWEKYGRP